MLDSDLAEIYGVTTKRLNEQVKRNQARFPEDFMFVLRKEELESLKSQFATSKKVRGGRRTLPFVFTEHGALMIVNVLNSPIAISASIRVARAFIQMREMLTAHVDLKRKIERLEKKYESHDMQIKTVFDAIKSLLEPPKKAKKKIGFNCLRKRGLLPGDKNLKSCQLSACSSQHYTPRPFHENCLSKAIKFVISTERRNL